MEMRRLDSDVLLWGLSVAIAVAAIVLLIYDLAWRTIGETF
jgi:hypothetical protein